MVKRYIPFLLIVRYKTEENIFCFTMLLNNLGKLGQFHGFPCFC